MIVRKLNSNQLNNLLGPKKQFVFSAPLLFKGEK